MASESDQECPRSRDGNGHCVHWWDGDEPCCWCGADDPETESNEEVGGGD